MSVSAQSCKSFTEVNWRDDDDVAGFIRWCMRQKEECNGTFENQAQQNIAWYMGYQNLLWDDASGALAMLPNPEGRPRLVYNLIMPQVETLVGWLGRDTIELEVWPATDDQGDEETARLSTQVLGAYQDVVNYPATVEELDRWMLLTGDGYAKVCWDSSAGQPIDYAKHLEMDEAEFRRVYKREPKGASGELSVYCVPVFNLFWGPWGTPIEEADWCIELNERSLSYVADRYNIDPSEIAADDGDAQKAVTYRTDDIGKRGLMARHQKNSDRTIVVELWCRRTGRTPRGRHAVMIGGKIVENGVNPYSHGMLPYTAFKMLEVPDRVHGLCYVEQLLAPQSDFNANASQQVENRDLMANPYFLYQRGSITDFSQWNNRPGGMREYAGNTPPDLKMGAAMPSLVLQQQRQTQLTMQDIVGIHDVSQAKLPAGVKSGIAIQALQEQDKSRAEPVLRRRRLGHQRIGRMMLSTIAQFAREDRLIKCLSDEDVSEFVRFRGDLLVGQHDGPGIDYFDVRINAIGLPQSRAAALEKANTLLSSGGLKPSESREDREIIFDLLDLGARRGHMNPRSLDKKNARLENELMFRGQPREPRDFDDHETHIREHQIYQKRGFFRGADPQRQLLFQSHIETHMLLMAKQSIKAQQVLQQAMAEMGVAPPPAPGGAEIENPPPPNQ